MYQISKLLAQVVYVDIFSQKLQDSVFSPIVTLYHSVQLKTLYLEH